MFSVAADHIFDSEIISTAVWRCFAAAGISNEVCRIPRKRALCASFMDTLYIKKDPSRTCSRSTNTLK